MFGKKKRDVKEADLDPGVEVMMHYAKMERMRARLPPAEEVAEALKSFFASKYRRGQPVEDTQAQLALQSLRYLAHRPAEEGSSETTVMTGSFVAHASAVLSMTQTATASHVALGKELYDTVLLPSNRSAKAERRVLITYSHLLGQIGNARSALDLVMQYDQRTALESSDRHEEDGEGHTEEVIEPGWSIKMVLWPVEKSPGGTSPAAAAADDRETC